MTEKKGILIYHKYFKLLERLSSESQGQILMASMAYDATGEKRELQDPVAQMLFEIMVLDFDALRESWEIKMEAQRENGKKGGRPPSPRQPKTHGLIEKPNETQKTHGLTGLRKETQGISDETPETQTTYNDNDNDNNKDKDKDKDKENTHNIRVCECEPPILEPKYPKGLDWRQVLSAWDKVAGAPSPGDLYRFQAKHGRDILPLLDGLEAADFIGAIRNYSKIRASTSTWWKANPDIVTWTRKHLDRFLPSNFKPEEYEKEAEENVIDWDKYINPEEQAK